MQKLLSGYAATVDALLQAVDSSVAGDTLLLRSYVIERGESTEAVLHSLSRAAQRGVRVRLGMDRSPLSAFTRSCERSTTMEAEVMSLSRRFPEHVELEGGERPDHSKLFLLHKGGEPSDSQLILGSLNLGGALCACVGEGYTADKGFSNQHLTRGLTPTPHTRSFRVERFKTWRDFSLLVRGCNAVATVEELMQGRCSLASVHDVDQRVTFASNTPAEFCPLRFAAKLPLLRHNGVTQALEAFFSSPSARAFSVATAYIDKMGAQMLLRALQTGKDVTLTVPRTPNVYAHANRAALAWLVKSAKSAPGRLRLLLHPAMLHAKAAVALMDDSGVEAILGSANLKARSLTQFGELTAQVSGGQAALQLRDALDALVDESREVTNRELLYDPMLSAVETYLG